MYLLKQLSILKRFSDRPGIGVMFIRTLCVCFPIAVAEGELLPLYVNGYGFFERLSIIFENILNHKFRSCAR